MFTTVPTLDLMLKGLMLTTMGMLWVVLLVRVNGLRSFSKMTNFDFVMTVAVGSLLASASQTNSWNAFFQAMIAMAALFLVQFVTARLRRYSDKIEALMQNKPVILMRDVEIIDTALAETRVTRSDLMAKLREANVLDMQQVRAVVLEPQAISQYFVATTVHKTCWKELKLLINNGVKFSFEKLTY